MEPRRLAASPSAARLQVLLVALLFSTGSLAIKGCSMTGWQVASFRCGIAALAVLALVPASRRRWTGRTLLVGLAYAATLLLYAVANKLTTAANAIFLQSTAPLYLLVLAPWLLREPVRRRELPFLAAIALGMGLFFVQIESATSYATNPLAGNLLAALSGLTYALTVLGLRWLSEAEPGAGASAVVVGNVVGFLAALPLAVPVAGGAPRDWLILLYLGIVQIGVAYALLTRAIQYVPALEASLLLMLEPVLNPVWTWMVLNERPSSWALAGGVVILVATLGKTITTRARSAVS